MARSFSKATLGFAQLCLAFAFVLPVWTTSASAQDRVALVIGNSSYGTVAALDNPTRDATLIASTLETIGFEVTLLVDATQIDMKRALSQFGRRLRDGGADTTGLFYYAGHGVQSFGNNYLLPVDVALNDAADLDLVGVEAQTVLRQMASARNQTNFVILDACRNNPFSDIPEFNESGLAEMKAPTGTFLAYATAPGAVALDGTGDNSPFTKALAEQILTPGLAVEQMFKQVRVSVLEQTAGMQTPWDTSSLTSNFQFVQAPDIEPEALAALQLWQSVQATRDPVQIMLFLRGYPNSTHADEARALLSEVIASELAGDTPAPQQPVAAGPSQEEQSLFEAAQADPSVQSYGDYLAAFPSGTFSEFAKQEIAALQSATSVDPVGEGVTEPASEVETAATPSSEDQGTGTVRFDTPLSAPNSPIDGVLLSEVLDLSPEFPPVEGLPDEYWKTETCASCHEWTKDRLCDQSNVYLNLSAQRSLEKAHPFNGLLKRNLKQWAAGGCQ